MCNQSTWSNLWNCIRRTYLTIKNHQRKFYKILTSWRIQDTKTKLDDKKQCFYIPVKFLVTHEYKKPKRWHANMYMISQKNYNHLFATKHIWKAEKIKKITYPRNGTCVCKRSDSVIKLVSVLFGKCTTLEVTKCWSMVIRQPWGDQWKAEKLGAFWCWPITRCLIKSDCSWLNYRAHFEFYLIRQKSRAVQFGLHFTVSASTRICLQLYVTWLTVCFIEIN